MENTLENVALLTKIVTGAGGALAAAVAYLFKVVMGQSKEQIKMHRELGELQGRYDGIEQLSKEVLDVVHRASSKDCRYGGGEGG